MKRDSQKDLDTILKLQARIRELEDYQSTLKLLVHALKLLLNQQAEGQ